MMEEDFLYGFDLAHALIAARIVKRRDKIALRRELCAILNDLPRRKEIRQANHDKIMHNRRSEKPRCSAHR